MRLCLRTLVTGDLLRRWRLSAAMLAMLLVSGSLLGCRPGHPSSGFMLEPGASRTHEPQSDLQRAQADFKRGAYGLAEKHYRLAIEDNLRNAEAWLGLAATYDHLKRFDLADRAYIKLQSLTGENAVVLNNLGYSHTLRGDFNKAERLLERAQRMAPDDERVSENIEFLRQRREASRG